MTYGQEEYTDEFSPGEARTGALPNTGARFSSMMGRPPGLYPDPLNRAGRRLWDGAAWTGVTDPAGGPALPVLTRAGRAVNPRARRVRRGWFAGAALVAAGGAGWVATAGWPPLLVAVVALAWAAACAILAVVGAATQLAARALLTGPGPEQVACAGLPRPDDPRAR